MTVLFTLFLITVVVGSAVGLHRVETRERAARKLDRQLAAMRYRGDSR